jgi:hypothetical protein
MNPAKKIALKIAIGAAALSFSAALALKVAKK